MKKISELLKPYLLVIFGALLFLFHFNWLDGQGAYLALGIIAVILAAYFLVIGILSVALGERHSKKLKSLLKLIGTSVYALFLGAYFLILLINLGDVLGPNGWAISLVSVAASIGLGGLLFAAYFAKNKVLNRLTLIFGSIFVLVLLLDVLFAMGNPRSLGDIVIVQVIMYSSFVGILFSVFSELKEVKHTEKVEEVKEEAESKEEPKEETVE